MTQRLRPGLVVGVLLALVAAMSTTVATADSRPAAGIAKADLDHTGTGYPVYRIPALTRTNAGTLLASYDGRPTYGDVPNNIALLVRRSTDDGATWQDRQVVRYEPGKPGYGDPSLLVDRQTGRIFLFHAASVNQGFFGSSTGNDDNDPDVLHMDYSWSDDDGLSWQHRRLTSHAKNPAWAGLFAASGEGIQLRRGKYAGRLLQQYAIRTGGQIYAASLYSDDHGATWKFGNLLGPGMDENKTVELSDGTVMLNSRAAGGYRKIAHSTDGGVTYTGLRTETQLIDPANNGSIIRYDADAAPSSPESRKLLFSNTETRSGRRNLTVKQSCDDGRTWPIRRVVEPGAAEYSTLSPLASGRFGLLYERGGYQHISFASFGADWINGVCVPMTTTAPTGAVAGSTVDVKVAVTSQETGAVDNGRIRLDVPAGWTSSTAEVPTLTRGRTATVTVRVGVPAGTATNAYPLTARLTSDKGESVAQPVNVVVRGDAPAAWRDTRTLQTDGVHAVDVSEHLPAVRSLGGGAISVRFSTTQSAPAATLLSAADPVSQVRDLVVSLNSGKPYVEVRTGTNTYPVRLQSDVLANDGKEHELVAASNNGVTSLLLDGAVIAQAPVQGFFGTVPGLGNLTIGANRAYVAAAGGLVDRWAFQGTITGVTVQPG